jgi:hypothetical protein
MKTRALILSTFALSLLSFSAHAQNLGAPEYKCVPSNVSSRYPINSVNVRKENENKIFAEISFKTDIGNLVYETPVSYNENPKFSFPSWDGEGVNIITEKAAREFKTEKFSGCISGETEEFKFSASLACERVSNPQLKTLATNK